MTREEKLMPGGIPRWVRIYDNEGETADRYTVVYAGNYNRIGQDRREPLSHPTHPVVSMSDNPFHPQGVCCHDEFEYMIDCQGHFHIPPAIGRKCHLGKRITFNDLPLDCQKVVINNYKNIWQLT